MNYFLPLTPDIYAEGKMFGYYLDFNYSLIFIGMV